LKCGLARQPPPRRHRRGRGKIRPLRRELLNRPRDSKILHWKFSGRCASGWNVTHGHGRVFALRVVGPCQAAPTATVAISSPLISRPCAPRPKAEL
jgi:hypothetical protein